VKDLRLHLDDLRFAELAEIGRSLIPANAPAWTDHNVHDPGIMLMELLAWIADAQIYSLARMRRGERAAYAELMGVKPRGPIAAHGLLWPDADVMMDPARSVAWPRGTVITEDCACTADIADAPPFYSLHAIQLTTSRLTTLRALLEDGSVQDLTTANRFGGTAFAPFGSAPSLQSRLELEFTPAVGSAVTNESGVALLSLGVQVLRNELLSTDEHCNCLETSSPLRVTVKSTDGETPAKLARDTSRMFTRDGVLLIEIDQALVSIDGSFTLTIDCPSGAWLTTPKVMRILPNVIPVRQLELVDFADAGTLTGMPDEELALPRAGAQFGDGYPSIEVRVEEGSALERWEIRENFERSGTDDRHVRVDFNTGRLRFGNGVNGKRAPAASAVQTRYFASLGARGNLLAGQNWTIEGIAGLFGTNTAAMQGGEDASTLETLQILSRRNMREQRPIVSSADLEAAALAFKDLNVVRAAEMTRTDLSRAVRGSRQLIVASGLEGNPVESSAWLQEIRRRLVPRLPLGQRLEVIAPRYVAIQVHAKLEARPRVAVEQVVRDSVAELGRRLAIVAENGEAGWAFGKPLSVTTVSGWLRKVEGVARVLSVQLVADEIVADDGLVAVPRKGLPHFERALSDIQVARAGAGRVAANANKGAHIGICSDRDASECACGCAGLGKTASTTGRSISTAGTAGAR
jgi:hypothetical protein